MLCCDEDILFVVSKAETAEVLASIGVSGKQSLTPNKNFVPGFMIAAEFVLHVK